MPKGARATGIDLLRRSTDDEELIERTRKRIAERELTRLLALLRVKADMSQGEIAQKVGCSQSRISRMENHRDAELCLGDVVAYLGAVGHQVRVVIAPRSTTLVDEIKHHAFLIKRLMDGLCALAQKDGDIANGVSKLICHEIPYNLLKLVVEAAKALPPECLEKMAREFIDEAQIECVDESEIENSYAGQCDNPGCQRNVSVPVAG